MTIFICIGIVMLWFASYAMLGFALNQLDREYLILVSILIMVVLTVIFKRVFKLTFNKNREKNKMLLTATVLAGVGTAFFCLIAAVPFLFRGTLPDTELTGFSLQMALFSLLAAVAEEFFFRGILLNLCKPHFKMPMVIIFQALLFACCHLSPYRFIHTFVCGLVFGYFYYYSEKIYVPILLHFMVNFLSGFMITGFIAEFTAVLTGMMPAALIYAGLGAIIIAAAKRMADKHVFYKTS